MTDLATDRPGRGIALRLLSGVLFAGMAVCVKLASNHVSTGQIVFYRSAFALIPLVIFLWWRGELRGGLSTQRPLGTSSAPASEQRQCSRPLPPSPAFPWPRPCC